MFGASILMRKLDLPSSLDSLTAEFADEAPFEIDSAEIRAFEHEPFFRLPGATEKRVNEHYALWSQQHLAAHLASSLRVLSVNAG